MKILALAIFTYENEIPKSTSGLIKAKFAQKSIGGFFSYDPLKVFEQKTFPLMFNQSTSKESMSYQGDDEFYYLRRDDSIKAFFVIISDRKLEFNETGYLFHNMRHVLVRGNLLNTTLDDMLNNPLNYIGRDLLVKTIGGEVEELKEQVFVLKDKVLERGENLKAIEAKTIRLTAESENFAIQAKRMNRCCSWYG